MIYRSFISLSLAALVLGCVATEPGAPQSAIQMPQQDCAACMEENPGDVVVCERICHEHLGDSAGRNAGSVLR
jgi:hypothetical protein